ncbi:toll-like receptor 5 [Sardina pilchardus]|uniref:toll-like receptor 5 n=1 Tax=Sardina pilchardus TaxID=27697 RepID=UPI002E166739
MAERVKAPWNSLKPNPGKTSFRMTTGTPGITILSLGLLICLLMANCSQQCIIVHNLAYCSGKRLAQVPPLPPSITHLDLSLNYIHHLSEESFIGLEYLVYLDLGSQRVGRLVIQNNAFRGLYNLTFLHLGDNRGMHIETDAFQGLSNLRTLVLLHCGLDERILSGNYLRPLLSLQELNLFGNKIKQFTPAMFFRNMTSLSDLDLSINRMKPICETDLVAFQDKHFQNLKLSTTVDLAYMNPSDFNWTNCGNPFKNISFDTLDLSNNGLGTERATQFFSAIKGTKINHLIFSSNNMGPGYGFNNFKDPDRFTFEPLKSSGIKIIDLSNNYINILKWAVFRSLSDVVSMSLADNKINQFEKGAFVGLTHLQRLNLSNNLIGEIYRHTFQNMPNLILLDLTNNHIGVVQHESFSELSSLLALDLTGNSLTSVYTFARLPNLQELHLDDNKIDLLYKLGDVASSVTTLKVNKNRLRNMEDLYIILATFPNVVALNFSDNFFSYCAHNSNDSIPSSNRLTVLDLRNSALQFIWGSRLCLDLFDHLNKVQNLYLSFNLLESLPEGIFKGLTSLNYLDLSHNSLTHLKRDVFPLSLKFLDFSYNLLSSPDPEVFRSLVAVDLKVNRFYCDCYLRDFQAWASNTTVEFETKLSDLQCEFPRELRGVALSNFTSDQCEEDDEQLVQALQFILFVSCSTFLVTLTLGTIGFARFRGHAFTLYKKLKMRIIQGQPQVPPELDNLQYDVYLCFAEKDFVWVESALLQRLDSQFAEHNQLRCCFEARDFIPGEDHLTNIRSAIWGSRKTLCVVSKEFLKDGWCLEAFMLAQGRMLEELKDVLVMVIVGSIPPFRLMKYEPVRTFVKNREYLQWPDDYQDREWFFDRLIVKIFKDSKVKCPKRQNDGPEIELNVVRQVGI